MGKISFRTASQFDLHLADNNQMSTCHCFYCVLITINGGGEEGEGAQGEGGVSAK